MSLQTMKEKWKSGDYDVYAFINNTWGKVIRPDKAINLEIEYQAIHKRHSIIAEAVAHKPDIKVEQHWGNLGLVKGWHEINYNFFEGYDMYQKYRLAEPSGLLSNCRFHVTPDNKDEIEAFVREHGYEIKGNPNDYSSHKLEHRPNYLCFVMDDSFMDGSEVRAIYSFYKSPNYLATIPKHLRNGKAVGKDNE